MNAPAALLNQVGPSEDNYDPFAETRRDKSIASRENEYRKCSRDPNSIARLGLRCEKMSRGARNYPSYIGYLNLKKTKAITSSDFSRASRSLRRWLVLFLFFKT